MKAFHNDPAIKQMYLDRIAAHRSADELIKGTGWEDGKGCAIGCTFHSYSHEAMEREWDVPQMLAHLEDAIFEGLPNGDSQAWPEQFTNAIPVGSDQSTTGWKFLHWLLTDSGIEGFNHESVRDAVAQCAEVLVPLMEGKPINVDAADAAAARAAEAAADVAARAADAAGRADSAAKAAAWAAGRAAWAADAARAADAVRAAWAADAAAKAAADAAAKAAAWAAGRAAARAYRKMANKLIELVAAA